MTTTPTVNTSIGPNRVQQTIRTITGQDLELQTDKEKKYYEEARDKYLAENKFTAASDLRALDRLLLLEVQMFRAQWQLASGVDYDLNFLTAQQEKDLHRLIKELTPMISSTQNDLGLTKAQRDKDQHESVGQYINDLKVRAKAFGVMREKQLGKALELTKDLFSVAGAYKRANEAERKKLGYESAEDVVDYILEVFKPQFDEVDEYFRTHDQKNWVRSM